MSARNLDAQNEIRKLKGFRERYTPTVTNAVLPITNDLVSQLVLPTKNKLIRTAARTRKQLDGNTPSIQLCEVSRFSELLEM